MNKFNIFKRIYKDIVNYKNFKKTIKKEKNNPQSIYNTYGFQHNKSYTKLGCIITLGDEYSSVDTIERDLIVFEKIIPITNYFDIDLCFGECLYIEKPDVWLAINDNGEMVETLSYKIELSYEFNILTKTNLIKSILISGIGIMLYRTVLLLLQLL
ncbi:MAG: hypothetical protein ACRDD8_11020 [Bacteroidales bacterium]